MSISLTAIIPIGSYENRKESVLRIVEEVKNESSWLSLILVFASAHAEADEALFRSDFPTLPPEWILVTCDGGDPGSARNTGLQYCSSKMVVFWDDDDLPQLDEIKRVISNCSGQEVVVTQYLVLDQESKQILRRSKTTNTHELSIDSGLWRIFFPTSIARNVQFPPAKLGEDRAYLAMIFHSAVVFLFSNEVTYKYMIQKSSLTKQPDTSGMQDYLLVLSEIARKPNAYGLEINILYLLLSATYFRLGIARQKLWTIYRLLRAAKISDGTLHNVLGTLLRHKFLGI